MRVLRVARVADHVKLIITVIAMVVPVSLVPKAPLLTIRMEVQPVFNAIRILDMLMFQRAEKLAVFALDGTLHSFQIVDLRNALEISIYSKGL